MGLVFLLFLGGLACLVILRINNVRLPGKLHRRGVSIAGRITYRFVVGSPPCYILVYRYWYNGSTYARDEEVESEVYYTVDIGDTVGVRCLPEHPQTARLEYTLSGSKSGIPGATPKEASFTETLDSERDHCFWQCNPGSSSHLGILALQSYFFSTRNGW
jgi:hypothetical protein